MSRIAWLDLETTCSSTKEKHACILEVGAVITDMDLEETLDAFSAFVNPGLSLPRGFINEYDLPDEISVDDANAAVFARMDPYVQEMHTKNGLWERATASVGTMDSVDDALRSWLNIVSPQEQVALAGSGVSHFDKHWISTFLPRSAEKFTYYTYDVGVLRRFLRDLAFVDTSFADPQGVSGGDSKAHRAIDDARAHLNEARSYVNRLSAAML